MSAVMEEKKSRAAGLLTSLLRLKHSVYEVSLLHPGHPGGSLLHPEGSLLHPGHPEGSLLHPGHPEGSLLHPGHPGGSLLHPEGSLLHPEGSLLHPGHPEGSLLHPGHPGGSLLHPEGSLLHPGHPEGSLLHPGGSLQHPGHPEVSLLHPGHPEGSLQHPEGSLLHPGGSLQHPEGSLLHPGGSLQHPEGSLLHPGHPEGSLQHPEVSLLHPGHPEGSLLHPGGSLLLRWRKAQQPFKLGVCHSVPVSEVIAVRALDAASSTTTGTSRRTSRQKSSRRWKKIPQRDEEDSTHAFTVSYVERTRQPGWRCRDVTFVCPEAALCSLWVRTLTEQISALANRPRRLLVYINPYSGKKRGERIYQHKVAPLFSRAGISTHVIVTEHANHARDHLRTAAELQNYDGVVCVGGDGMFSEVMHGLVWRTQSDRGRDHTSPDQTLAPTALRIGIIPAGSTDCICFATVGANDPVTSALHIIVGDCQPMDVCSVHHNDTFLRYSVSLLGYGFYGDVLSDSERKRWMGPARYDISGVKTFLSHQYYEGTVSYLPASDALGTPRDRTPCRTGCVVCQYNRPLEEKEENHKMEESDDGGAWRSVRGKFLAINAVSMSCACPRSPQGLSPAAHLADGTTDLILVRKCSRLAFLRHLLRHTSKEDQFDLSFVEVHRVRRFHFTPRFCQSDLALDLEELLLEKEVQEKEVAGSQAKRILGQICREHPACCLTSSCSSCWNCDGEILPHAAIQVRAHRQLIQLFARGIEETHLFDDITSP